jgi:RNA polymerase sigma-70 factor (ECF subfamily)
MNSPEPVGRDQERLWVLRAQRGDVEAFRLLVERHDRRLLYFVLRLLPNRDRALDILQDTWLTLVRRLANLRSPDAFRVWLYQIAHDRVVDVLRRERCQRSAFEVLREGAFEALPSHEELIDQADLVHHALDQLSADHREVLLLRFLEDLSLEEISATLRCSLGTVKSRLHYARRALRQEVERLVHE